MTSSRNPRPLPKVVSPNLKPVRLAYQTHQHSGPATSPSRTSLRNPRLLSPVPYCNPIRPTTGIHHHRATVSPPRTSSRIGLPPQTLVPTRWRVRCIIEGNLLRAFRRLCETPPTADISDPPPPRTFYDSPNDVSAKLPQAARRRPLGTQPRHGDSNGSSQETVQEPLKDISASTLSTADLATCVHH